MNIINIFIRYSLFVQPSMSIKPILIGNDSNIFVIQSNHDEVDEWVQYICNLCFFDEPTLIILDDVAGTKDVKNTTSKLVNLSMSGRHVNISICIITQQLTSISKPIRNNLTKLVSFYNPSKKDAMTLL